MVSLGFLKSSNQAKNLKGGMCYTEEGEIKNWLFRFIQINQIFKRRKK
jgi:hypothetical protein